MTVVLKADVAPRATTRHAVLGRLPRLLETMSEEQCWSRSTAIANDAFGAASSAAFELIEPHRIELRAERGDVDWMHGAFPVAPDSQAAYVLAADGVVTSAELDVDRRFVAAPMLIRAGIRSAMSCRFDLPAGAPASSVSTVPSRTPTTAPMGPRSSISSRSSVSLSASPGYGPHSCTTPATTL